MRPQARVDAVHGEQLGVRALLDDAASVHHDEPVQRRDGGQAVCNGHHRLALHQRVQALLDGGFNLAVQRAGGLVQKQDGRVFQHHAGDGNALALAAAELHAALAHEGLEAGAALGVRQARDELIGMRALGRAVHLGRRGVGPAVEDVVSHRAVQE